MGTDLVFLEGCRVNHNKSRKYVWQNVFLAVSNWSWQLYVLCTEM